MTTKGARKMAARARQRKLGGKYQHHLRQVEGARDPFGANDGANGATRVLITRRTGQGDLETTVVDVVYGPIVALVKLSAVADRGSR